MRAPVAETLPPQADDRTGFLRRERIGLPNSSRIAPVRSGEHDPPGELSNAAHRKSDEPGAAAVNWRAGSERARISLAPPRAPYVTVQRGPEPAKQAGPSRGPSAMIPLMAPPVSPRSAGRQPENT